MPWKPGRSGNPAGRPKRGSSLAERLRTAVESASPEIVAKLIELATTQGDIAALRLILEYSLGKPATVQVEIHNAGAAPRTYVGVSPDDWPTDE